MIITSREGAARWAMFDFLRARGVKLHRSDDFQALGRVGAAGELIGVVGYNGFCGLTCQIHAAGAGHWLSREFIFKAFDYPFRQCGMEHIFAPVAAKNMRSLRLVRHLGFTDFASIADGYERGTALNWMRMTRRECRWIEQERRAA